MDERNKTTIEKLQSMKPGFTCALGHSVKTQTIGDPGPGDERAKILELIKIYLAENRLRVVDLFNRWDKDRDFSITRKEFVDGVKASRLPLNNHQVGILLNCMDDDDNGMVDYKEFAKIFND